MHHFIALGKQCRAKILKPCINDKSLTYNNDEQNLMEAEKVKSLDSDNTSERGMYNSILSVLMKKNITGTKYFNWLYCSPRQAN